MVVAKFGGTSVRQHLDVIDKIVQETLDGEAPYTHFVFSAPGSSGPEDSVKVTGLLGSLLDDPENEQIIDQIVKKYDGIADESEQNRLRDLLVERSKTAADLKHSDDAHPTEAVACIKGWGEEVTEQLMAKRFDLPAAPGSHWQILDLENGDHTKGTLAQDTAYALLAKSASDKPLITGGYSGRTKGGKYATFDTGGSDITQVHAAIGRGILEIHNFTDSPIYAANPNVVKRPDVVNFLTYSEARDLTGPGGFTILHKDVVKLAQSHNIQIEVRGTKEYPEPGTKIVEFRHPERPIVGIGYEGNFGILSFHYTGMDERDNSMWDIYDTLKNHRVSVKMDAPGTDNLSVMVSLDRMNEDPLLPNSIALEAKDRFGEEMKVTYETGYGCLIISGVGIESALCIEEKILSVIHAANIQDKMSSKSSEGNSFLYGIRESEATVAQQVLHQHLIRDYRP